MMLLPRAGWPNLMLTWHHVLWPFMIWPSIKLVFFLHYIWWCSICWPPKICTLHHHSATASSTNTTCLHISLNLHFHWPLQLIEGVSLDGREILESPISLRLWKLGSCTQSFCLIHYSHQIPSFRNPRASHNSLYPQHSLPHWAQFIIQCWKTKGRGSF